MWSSPGKAFDIDRPRQFGGISAVLHNFWNANFVAMLIPAFSTTRSREWTIALTPKQSYWQYVSNILDRPIHLALDWIDCPSNRSAVAALLCRDFFLGRYAGNFFAKAFIPQRSAHVQDASNLAIEPSRVCIHCWHLRRQLILESEGHVFFECPRYEAHRAAFVNGVSDTTKKIILEGGSGVAKLVGALGSQLPTDWAAFGIFCGRLGSRDADCGKSLRI